jgi:regulator of protease activity HflC (stomatin/prohibitin superfamily)
MFGIGYYKGQPTDFVLLYQAGRVVASGAGLAFFYLRYRSQIVAVPTQSLDASFVFNEVSRDYQDITIQGQLTYRIRDPQQAAGLLNYRINPTTGTYVSDDPDKLAGRVSNLVQIETRAEVAARSLPDVLREATALAASVAERLRAGPRLGELGVELLAISFLSVRPTPEVGKAMEAEFREALLRKADIAVYARRAAAIDEERTIKEKELASDVALEEQRKQLIILKGANAIQDAEQRAKAAEIDAQAQARASELQLAVFRGVEPRVLVAHALRELGQRAGQIGNLTITTELLASLLATPRAE